MVSVVIITPVSLPCRRLWTCIVQCPIDSTGVQKRRVLCQGKVAEDREGRLRLLWRVDGVFMAG